MIELPCIKIDKPNRDYAKELDDSFSKLLKYDDREMEKELMESTLGKVKKR